MIVVLISKNSKRENAKLVFWGEFSGPFSGDRKLGMRLKDSTDSTLNRSDLIYSHNARKGFIDDLLALHKL